MNFGDQVVLVTGAGSGIGRAVARRLIAEGTSVVLTDVNESGLAVTLEEVSGEATRDHVLAQHLDVTDDSGWNDAVAAAMAHFGRLTGLVNNAGVTRDATMLRMEPSDFDLVLSTHLRASWLGCRAVIPALRKSGGGAIVNVSSSGRHGSFGQTNYSSAKAGIVGLTKSVALEQARYGIRCNAVAPGAIHTPMTDAVPQRVKDEWASSIALGRMGEPEEIAAAVRFLLSPDSSYVTAQVLDVNGGETHL